MAAGGAGRPRASGGGTRRCACRGRGRRSPRSRSRGTCVAWLHARRGLVVRQEPRERFGHRLDERDVILRADEVLCEEPERSTERGPLGLVSLVAVHRLPRDEGALRLGQPEEAPAELLPRRPEVGLLDRGERGLLVAVVRLAAPRTVLVPAPRRAGHSG